MFKVGIELPEVAVESPKSSKQKKKQNNPLNGNDLQNMMSELSGTKRRIDEPSANKKQRTSTKEEGAGSIEVNISKHASKNDHNKVKQNKGQLVNEPNASSTKKVNNITTDAELKTKKGSERSTSNTLINKIGKNLTPMQLKMQQKLSGARFRWINEQLYTTDSQKSFEIFQKQPEVFKEYHDGFKHQVEQWPENPVVSFVEQFKERTLKRINAPGGLPGTKSGTGPGTVVVADMGCGEAELALKLQQFNENSSKKKAGRRVPTFQVHSFDMHKGNDRITVADIANVPLPDASCHVVVFCLALMGTNLTDFINEAIRILEFNGLVWIAEIKSRFNDNDYSEFVETLKGMGLYHKNTDDSNKMFVKFEFVKLSHKLEKAKNMHPNLVLKPCIYKRR